MKRSRQTTAGSFPLSLSDETLNEVCQGPLVTAETRNHRLQKSIGIKIVKIERVAGLIGEKQEKRELSTAISLSESMDGVQVGQEVSRSLRKFLGREALQELVGF